MTDPEALANRDQARASDPAVSAWVSANAGSGKTHVLVNRVIRLLLAGTPPERILCLTYTRAAAAEMSRRLFATLAGWIPLADDELTDRIHRISGTVKFGGDLKAARRLFARALDTPGGLKIQTIHAFCERLLQRFPVEAGVVPGFKVLDELEARELLSAARDAVLAEARTSSGAAAATLARIVAFAGADDLDLLITELLAKGSELKSLLADEHHRERAIAGLSTFLGVGTEADEGSVWQAAADGIDRPRYISAAELLAGSAGKTDLAHAELIASALAAPTAEQAFTALKALFLKKTDGAPKADRTVSGLVAKTDQGLADYLLAERDRIASLAGTERAIRVRDASAALFAIADLIIGRYEAEKRRLGRCDYDDLIANTLSLLRNVEHAAWVLYRLDGGLDHILIDEAQDTSPEQWQVVKWLAEEFFAGEGQRPDVCRTVFAVGDRKQSIFSFQGADPDGFDAMRRHFAARASQARQAFETVRPTVSFRSTQTILDAVDEVFAQAAAGWGVVEDDGPRIVHRAVREGEPGLIEIWEPEKSDPTERPSPWRAGSDADPARHPRLRLARRIALTIRDWIDRGEKLAATGEPLRPGDILVLLRNRTTFMDALVRALRQAGIAVAGADRLVLTRHIAIEDLLAVARFALLPEDDLTLASVLKSPLVARDDGRPIDDDDLFTLAWGRGSSTLWNRLRAVVAAGAPYASALARLERWRLTAVAEPPYEFFSRILNSDGGRMAIMARLGPEAAEPLDAFLALALDFAPDRSQPLPAFLDAVSRSGAEIKRDMDQGLDEVRVMTVHGAKGLEAPIVILPDTCDAPSGRHDPRILIADEAVGGGRIPVWRLKSAFETAPLARLKQAHRDRSRQEYNRLLYVAMTRARDRLYVAGCQTTEALKDECWYSLIAAALKPKATELRLADGRTVWRIEDGHAAEPRPHRNELEPPVVAVTPPDWALRPPPPEPRGTRWLVASRLDLAASEASLVDREPVLSPLAGAQESRFRRGRLIHRLLQSLPELPEAERAAAARRYLDRAAGDLGAGLRRSLAEEALSIVCHPSLKTLFGPGSLAEVPLTAIIGNAESGSIGLTGQIDRLAVTDREALIADYKTNRPPPASPEATDPLYLRQLAAYRAAIVRLYPGRPVRCLLVWTEGPRLMEVPGPLLDAALPIAQGSPA